MHPAELLPVHLSHRNQIRQFLCQMIDRYAVMFGHLAVGGNRRRGLPLLQLAEDIRVHKMSHHDVDLRIILPRLRDDALHAAQRVVVVLLRVLVVIHYELYKQHVQRPLAQHVLLQTKGSGIRTG